MVKSRELYRDFRDKMLLSRELQLRLIQIVLGCVATLTDGVIIIISNQTSSVVKAGPGRAHAHAAKAPWASIQQVPAQYQ